MTSVDRHAAAAAPRATRWYVLLALLVGGSAWLYLSPRSAPAVWRGDTMGTTYTVKLARPVDASRAEALGASIRAELDAVVAAMSTYEPDSEVSRLARAPAKEKLEVSAATMAVLMDAASVARASGGAFDVTVRPLVDAWGFGAAGRTDREPSEAGLARLAASIGWDKLELDGNTVTKATDAVQVDLSGIAKGYAVDRVAAALESNGIEDYFVEVGGEARARGRNDRGAAWRIAIQRPGDRAVAVELDGHGVATSGNDKNYWERDGRRYGHTIDPRTHAPVRHQLAGASVVHASTALADAWATALMVLGEVEGWRVAEDQGLAAAFFVVTDEGPKTKMTEAFEAFLAQAGREGTP